MPMTCPRCETSVPDEALYCPYCNLPKPKSGFVAAARPSAEATRHSGEPRSPVTFRKTRAANHPHSRPQRHPRSLRLPVLGATALVVLLCVGAYMYVVPLVRSEGPEPKAVLAALERLRRMPSDDPDLTIDARMSRELERSRRVGNLVAYQGWTIQRIKGTKTKVLLVFSYQEAGDVKRRAEWLADLTNNTFTPQTDMAASVSNQR